MKYKYILNYLDKNYFNEIYNHERSLLHERIVDSYFINKKKSNRTIIFTGGCYGSGKSHVLKELHKHSKINLDNYIFIDPDQLRSFLPEYSVLLNTDPWNAGLKTNKEVFFISELIKYHALFNKYPVIYDSSLKDYEWVSKHFEWLYSQFEDIKICIIHVYASWIHVLERNLIRAEQTKRCIPLRFIKNAYDLSIKSNEHLKDIVDLNIVIKNDSDDELNEQLKNLKSIDDQLLN